MGDSVKISKKLLLAALITMGLSIDGNANTAQTVGITIAVNAITYNAIAYSAMVLHRKYKKGVNVSFKADLETLKTVSKALLIKANPGASAARKCIASRIIKRNKVVACAIILNVIAAGVTLGAGFISLLPQPQPQPQPAPPVVDPAPPVVDPQVAPQPRHGIAGRIVGGTISNAVFAANHGSRVVYRIVRGADAPEEPATSQIIIDGTGEVLGDMAASAVDLAAGTTKFGIQLAWDGTKALGRLGGRLAGHASDAVLGSLAERSMGDFNLEEVEEVAVPEEPVAHHAPQQPVVQPEDELPYILHAGQDADMIPAPVEAVVAQDQEVVNIMNPLLAVQEGQPAPEEEEEQVARPAPQQPVVQPEPVRVEVLREVVERKPAAHRRKRLNVRRQKPSSELPLSLDLTEEGKRQDVIAAKKREIPNLQERIANIQRRTNNKTRSLRELQTRLYQAQETLEKNQKAIREAREADRVARGAWRVTSAVGSWWDRTWRAR
jgi:hypothetical protein